MHGGERPRERHARRPARRRWLTRAVVVATALVVVTAIALSFRPKPLSVDVAVVRRGPLVVALSGEGHTRVRERFVVTAPLTGVLSRIGLEAGDPVSASLGFATMTPLPAALLDPRDRAGAEAMVAASADETRRAAAALERATVMAEAAATQHLRLARLFGAGAVSRVQLEEADDELRARRADVDAARAAVSAAEHQRRRAAAALGVVQAGSVDRVAITSPIDGVVLRVVQESGGVVQAGAPIVEVGDLRRLEVVVDVLSRDAVSLRAGMRARVDAGNGRSLSARVRRVEPSAFTDVSALGVREQRVNVVVDFAEAPPAALGDGYELDVSFVLHEAERALLVPLSALFRDGARWAVYVVRDGKASMVHVAVGPMSDTDVEVVEGLVERDVVVVHPPDAVRPGVDVVARAD